jgi:putative hydrolase of the HAD superfamily
MARAPVWLFDLDNTLHDSSFAIYPAMNRLMTAFIQDHLGLDEAAASKLREDLWHRYGATLLGLVRHHGVNAEDFLRLTHDFENLPGMIRRIAGMRRALRRLPGRKILLTNAPRDYAEKVLFHIGLAHHFPKRYAVEQMKLRGRWMPKPSRTMLAHVLARERVDPRRVIFVEDSLGNLKRAKILGVRTVLVTGLNTRGAVYAKRPLGVGLKLKFATELPRAIARLRRS